MDEEIEVKSDTQMDETTEEVLTEETEEVSEVEDLKQKNKELFARAKKAEGFVLVDGEWVKKPKVEVKEEVKPKSEDLTTKDFLTLAKADVHEEDVDRVIKFAKDNNMDIAKALKDDDLIAILESRTEKRKSAEVTTTGTRRAPTGKISDEKLLSDFAKGESPEPNTPEAERLFLLRRNKNR